MRPTFQFAICALLFLSHATATNAQADRNPVRGPHYRNLDMALIKPLLFGEGRSVEFRAEVFNLANTPPLGAPATVVGAAGFGSITPAGAPRVIQFGAKLNLWFIKKPNENERA